jgi:hypothetical protein
MLYTPAVFSPRSSFMGSRRLIIFLEGMPTDLMLCLDSIWKKGDRSELLQCCGNSLWWTEGPSDLPVTAAVPLESVPEELQRFMEAFVMTQGSGPMYQCGKHSLFARRVVVGVGMEIEAGVRGTTVDSMAQ